jgi:radical SAM protein with 4Fe4S-binding SPASM domain
MDGELAEELPRSITLQVTDACNLRCKMCYDWGETGIYGGAGGPRKAAVLDVKLAKRVIRELEPAHPMYSLFGGEPLMYPDLEELVRAVKQAGSLIDTPTNGTLLRKHAAMLVDAGFDFVRVSLDGPREINDRQRGAGSYDEAMAGIAALQEEKLAAGKATPLVGIICTVTPENHAALEQLFLHDLNLDAISTVTIQLQNYVTAEMGEAYAQLLHSKFNLSSERYWRALVRAPDAFTGIDTAVLARQTQRVCQHLQGLGKAVQLLPPTLTEPSLNAYFAARWNAMADTYTRCCVPWLAADITATGDVAPCHVFYDLVIGNLHDHSFAALWNGEHYRTLRTQMQTNGLLPICAGCCILYLAN